MSKLLPQLLGKTINTISYFQPKLAAKYAVKLFSTPQKGQITEEQKPFLNTAIHDAITFDDITIKTYLWGGSKDTILLVHGWESNAFRWKDLIELLQKEDYNIVAIDAPAHGGSNNKIFNAILYSECINVAVKTYKPSIVIGHSIGGTASIIAQENYDLPVIKKNVLLGAPSNLAISVKNYANFMGFNKIVTKAVDTYYLKHFKQLPGFYCAENFYKNNDTQGIIIHDKKDKIISYREALDIKRYYKNAELIKTIGLGHRLKSNDVYQHILEFLKA
ncbi:alpha/beta hydrolase [Tamlana sp. 2_MG-2023]|uniref:alpha/beta hydrolase n=1 Tax=unclassified Tamlana TaxID=2614803 RepID=UPI0026E3ECAA|nr:MULTISPECIES: alpha/beta hydrolase [unclassified Tamlana]MDO6760810.1 alpha/beta hydrolase [Tamlana sp. 2_MG-2023]MDO6791066.1 alpha/beta hydrolase [Tamlana sp. 1_MG-2023]